MKKRFLILGDGLLGSELTKQTGWDYVSRKKDGFDIFSPELLSTPLLIGTLENFAGSYTDIVNCIGYTNTRDNTKKLHWETNVMFVKKLSDYCAATDTKLIHISTDYVYANSIMNAKETDVPLPIANWYGQSKVMADAIIESIFPKETQYLILRGTFKKRPYQYEKAWYNLVGNFDYIDTIASLMIKLIVNDAYGIYNVGTERKSLFTLAQQTNPDVIPHEDAYDVNKYLRPYDTTMDLTKMNIFLENI